MTRARGSLVAALVAALIGFGPAGPTGATTPKQPGPAQHVCFGPRQATVTMTDAWTPWLHSYWHLNFQWCSTGILWGRVYGEKHWQSFSNLDGLLEGKPVVEDQSSYYTYRGIPNAGRRIHVKGLITNCFFGWCNHLYPEANVWVHADGSYHTSTGLG